MSRAATAARHTFPEFARHAELEHWREEARYELVAVLFAGVAPALPQAAQMLFATNIRTDGGLIAGQLACEPESGSGLSWGQEVTFDLRMLIDWFLVRTDGIAYGGFTVDVLREVLPAEALRASVDWPPLVWYPGRTDTYEITRLASLPACPKCGQQELGTEWYIGGVCGVCANGARRCECLRCGAPLIRHPDYDQQECYHCSATR